MKECAGCRSRAPLAGVEVNELLPVSPHRNRRKGADRHRACERLRLGVIAGHLREGSAPGLSDYRLCQCQVTEERAFQEALWGTVRS